MLHGGGSDARRTDKIDRTAPVVIFADGLGGQVVYVHAKSVETDISWQAKPIARLQAGAKYAVTRQAIVDDVCGPGLYLILNIIQRQVTVNGRNSPINRV